MKNELELHFPRYTINIARKLYLSSKWQFDELLMGKNVVIDNIILIMIKRTHLQEI